MSERLTIKKLPKSKKLTQAKVEAVKSTAPMNEKSKKREPQKRGQPKKEEAYKQNLKLTIYLSEAQIEILEQKAIKDGYTPKDRGKWLKKLAIAPKTEIESTEQKEVAILKEKLKSCQSIMKQKDEMIEILKSK